MARLIRPRSEKAVLDEATEAFSGMDGFVDALTLSTHDDGESAIAQMVHELEVRVARYRTNLVVQSTAIGLEKAYRLSILQRIIDDRLGTRRSQN